MIQEAPIYPPAPAGRHLSFRSSRIVYYGPHACSNCGVLVAKMGHEFGGNAFTYPEGPIYPNTEWHPHVCDPKLVAGMPREEANHRACASSTGGSRIDVKVEGRPSMEWKGFTIRDVPNAY